MEVDKDKMTIKSLIKILVANLGYYVVKKSTLDEMKTDVVSTVKNVINSTADKDLIQNFFGFLVSDSISDAPLSKSQLGQDFFALATSNGGVNKFFIEIGGGDPIISSNSYLLQKGYGWKGIIVEPNPKFIDLILSERCQDGDVELYPFAIAEKEGTSDFLPIGLIGTLPECIDGDFHGKQRRQLLSEQKLIKIEKKSPKTFVEEVVNGRKIDFLSVDTEGSEWEIIKNWPFEACKPHAICVEVNNRAWKLELTSFLISQGYSQKMEAMSKFDSWFILSNR
jgi:FkbM family methyltransferase